MSTPDLITRQALDLALSLLATYSPPPAVGHIVQLGGQVGEVCAPSPKNPGPDPSYFVVRNLATDRTGYVPHQLPYYPHGDWLFLAHNRDEYEQRLAQLRE